MKKSADGADTPEHRIRAAARDLLFSEGFGQVTTDRLAQSAGVSKTTIYKYFGDMTGVLRAVVTAEADAFQAGIILDPQTEQDFRDGVIRFGINLLTLVDDPQTIGFEMSILEQARTHPDVAHCFYEAAHLRTHAALCDMIEAGRRRGFVRSSLRSDHLADHLISLWKGNRHAKAQLGLAEDRKPSVRVWATQCVDLVLG